ncbi:MAG: hypothetical protein E6J01_04185 [Chloroflexi bacterium]|nr:MAG: hypothetical protein E6J01_04185 [Chloroflexota bacterium]
MHEPPGTMSLQFVGAASNLGSRSRAHLAFCYQCHCAVELRATSRALLRSGHWARMGTCPHCGTTVTRIVQQM